MYFCTTRRESLGHERVFFFGISFLSQRRNREYVPGVFCIWVCVCVCVCARVWATCSHYARRAFLMAVYSITFAHTSSQCRYMNSSGWLLVNLARFLVIILPAAENMRSGALRQEKWQVQRELFLSTMREPARKCVAKMFVEAHECHVTDRSFLQQQNKTSSPIKKSPFGFKTQKKKRPIREAK